MSAPLWTDAEKAELRRLAAEGLTSRQIEAKLGRSRSAVIGKAHRLGVELLVSPGYHGGAKVKAKKERVRSVAVRGAPQNGRLNAIENARKRLEAAPPPAGGMRFFDAVEANLCLHYVGSHMTRGGPDMPVCGAGRVAGRYCAHHAGLRYEARS